MRGLIGAAPVPIWLPLVPLLIRVSPVSTPIRLFKLVDVIGPEMSLGAPEELKLLATNVLRRFKLNTVFGDSEVKIPPPLSGVLPLVLFAIVLLEIIPFATDAWLLV